MKVVLQLLEGARAVLPRGEEVVLERKAAALLAIVALDKTAARARASFLLWPNVSEKTARGNLRQVLRRLRVAAGQELIVGRDPLSLGRNVQVDALQNAATGELLAGYEYDDCPEFAHWLTLRREQCRLAQRAALQEAADELELQGELHAALEVARRLTSVHPESELAHQRVMRLCLGLQDRPAAIHAYGVAVRVLRMLCDVEPSEATDALLQAAQSKSPVTR